MAASIAPVQPTLAARRCSRRMPATSSAAAAVCRTQREPVRAVDVVAVERLLELGHDAAAQVGDRGAHAALADVQPGHVARVARGRRAGAPAGRAWARPPAPPRPP